MSTAPPLTTAPTTAPIKVDRRRTTPFLLKLFYRQGGFHRFDYPIPLIFPLASTIQLTKKML